MELVGDGVKLIGENELVSSSGHRQSVGNVNKASKIFEMGFTKSYPQLADRMPLYADLRNLIDIAIAAAYIQQQEVFTKAGWKMEFFGDESAFPVETYEIPKTVETVVNAVWKGSTLVTPVSGGVHIEPTKALESDKLLSDEKGKVAKLRQEININLAKGQWWWDQSRPPFRAKSMILVPKSIARRQNAITGQTRHSTEPQFRRETSSASK